MNRSRNQTSRRNTNDNANHRNRSISVNSRRLNNSNNNHNHRSNNNSNNNRRSNNNNHHRSNNKNHHHNNNNNNQELDIYTCILCKKPHAIKSCRKFLRMDVKRREKFVEGRRYCINCLARSHDWRACPSIDRCRKCDAFHHTLLHPKRQPVTTKQLRQRATRANQPISLQQPTTPAQPNTAVISEAIKSLAAVLCASG